MADLIHPFEKAGLGKAPFRCIGVTENMWSPAPGEPAKPGGSCQYCSNGIRYEYHIVSADGRKFRVGSDCVFKVNAKGTRLYSDTKQALAQLKRHQRQDKEAKYRLEVLAPRVARAREILSANPTLLTHITHPAIPGKTRRDYVEWLLAHAGDAGKERACDEVISLRGE